MCSLLSSIFDDGSEEKQREKYCGIPPDLHTQTYSWLVALRYTKVDSYGNVYAKYYTGTLISNRFVVTAAENFDSEDPLHDVTKKLYRNWKAYPGVFGIVDVETTEARFNHEISRIDIHPLYGTNAER